MLALSGTARAAMNKSGHSRDLSVVKLYSPYGLALRTLKVGILFFFSRLIRSPPYWSFSVTPRNSDHAVCAVARYSLARVSELMKP